MGKKRNVVNITNAVGRVTKVSVINANTPIPVSVTEQTQITKKRVLIQNITFGNLAFPEFSLHVNETMIVDYTKRVEDYAAEKYIKIVKII